MKRRNRIIATFTSIAFGLAIIVGAVGIVLFFLPIGLGPIFNPDFLTTLKAALLVFDFTQTQFDVLTQYLTLGVLGFGVIVALLWLILGLVKKHFIVFLFFFLTLVCTAYWGLITFFGFEYFLNYLVSTSTLDIAEVIKRAAVFSHYILVFI